MRFRQPAQGDKRGDVPAALMPTAARLYTRGPLVLHVVTFWQSLVLARINPASEHQLSHLHALLRDHGCGKIWVCVCESVCVCVCLCVCVWLCVLACANTH